MHFPKYAIVSCACGQMVLASNPTHAFDFDEASIDVGFAIETAIEIVQDGKTNSTALLVSGRNDDGQKWVTALTLEHGQPSRLRLLSARALPDDVLFFDTASFGASEQVLLLGRSGVRRYDFSSGAITFVSEVQSIYRHDSGTPMRPLDFVADVNGDGRGDLLIPDFSGYRLMLQNEQEQFGDPVLLGLPTRMRINADSPRYLKDEYFVTDFDVNGRRDVLIYRNDVLFVFAQREDGTFAQEPKEISIDVELASERELEELATNNDNVDQSDLVTTTIYEIADLNNDDLLDIVTRTTLSSGVFDKQSKYQIHLAQVSGDGMSYTPTHNSQISSKGIQFDLEAVDINNDSRKDLISPSARFTLARVIAALFSGSTSLQVSIYPMNEEETYESLPAFSAKTKVELDLSSGQINFPAVEVADFDGDGLKDLLLQEGSDELEIRRGDGSERLFERHGHKLTLPLPRNGELLETTDVNGDGKEDIILRYSAADGPEANRLLRVFVSR